jgi:membrane dipeptidase
VAVIVGFLNAYPLARLEDLDALHAQDVRVVGLAHAGNTIFADSSRPQAGEGFRFGGLSELGRAAVQRLNDLGVLIDVSQLTANGVLQTVELSRDPVVASHSGVRALADNPRNLSDAEIDAIAAKGGVIQLTPFNAYLVPKPQDYDARLRALRADHGLPAGSGYAGSEALDPARRQAFMDAFRALYPRAGVKQYVDQIEYVAKRVGVDHVGVGSDFNHGAGIDGFADEADAPNVTRELVARGYREGDVAKVWGGNFLRVFDAAANAGRRAVARS